MDLVNNVEDAEVKETEAGMQARYNYLCAQIGDKELNIKILEAQAAKLTQECIDLINKVREVRSAATQENTQA